MGAKEQLWVAKCCYVLKSTFNYQHEAIETKEVQDDPKLSGDSGGVPISEVVGSSIPILKSCLYLMEKN